MVIMQNRGRPILAHKRTADRSPQPARDRSTIDDRPTRHDPHVPQATAEFEPPEQLDIPPVRKPFDNCLVATHRYCPIVVVRSANQRV